MTVLPGNNRSVASVLLAGHNDIVNPYNHPLLRFFTPAEARELRLVHPEFEVAVEATRFDDLETPVTDFRSWRAANRSAVSLRLSATADLADFAAFAATGALEGLDGRPGLQNLRVDPHPRMSFTPFGGVHADSIAGAVGRIPSLKELHVPLVRLGDVHGATLAAVLPPTLTLLDLSHNRMGPAGAAALAAALPRLVHLTTLRLSGNPFEPAGVAALAPVLPPTLTLLDLSDNRMGPAGAAALGTFLPRLLALTRVDFSWNGLTFADLRALLPGLPATLRELDLEGNDFGPAGAEVVAELLPHLRNLTHVDFSNNRLTAADLRALLPGLPATLRELDLEGNNFGPAGAEVVAELLPRFRGTLEMLNLAYNHLGDAGVQVLAPALRDHLELTELGLTKNDIGKVGIDDIGKVGIDALVAILPTLPKLRIVTFASNTGLDYFVKVATVALPSKRITWDRRGGDITIIITPRKSKHSSKRRSTRRRSTRRRSTRRRSTRRNDRRNEQRRSRREYPFLH